MAGVSLVLVCALVGPAGAYGDDLDNVSATDVEEALRQVPSGLLEEAAATSSTKDDVAVVKNETATLIVPQDSSESIDIELGNALVSIDLPKTEAAASAVALSNGAITYPSSNGAASTVVPLADGVQMLTTIASPNAPEAFAYQIDVPQGSTVSLESDGSATITDASGNRLISTTAPWAVDAEGISVPTRYELDGAALVQVVEHTSGDYAYPIVADPTYWWGGKTWVPANKVSTGQTASILYALIPGFVGPVALYNVGLGLCNQAGKGIWVYWTWAGHVWCTGP